MDHNSSSFFELNNHVNKKRLKNSSYLKLIDFYEGENSSLRQFFFSAISNKLTESESPFVIGYLSDVLSEKFLSYDFSQTGRKSMWKYVFDQQEIIKNSKKSFEQLSQAYQDTAELALFHSSFLPSYHETKSSWLTPKFFSNIGESMYKNSAITSSFSEKKELMNHLSYFFNYYSAVLKEVANDHFWSKNNEAYQYVLENQILIKKE